MKSYIEFYCKNDCAELRKISDKIIMKEFGWLPQMLYDDFYSIALEVLWRCDNGFDDTKGAKFETYLVNCLNKKFRTRVTYINRKRRNNGVADLSFEQLINDEDKITIGDMIADKAPDEISEKTQKYLDGLTKLQKRVAEMIMDGIDIQIIKNSLNLSDRRFNAIFQRMKAREKTVIFDEGNELA